ncbi:MULTISPECIES: SDR family NAD(P)-dependent oxidoreductase [Sphingopyxis]|uniref:Short-chain dehydrogenase/reductase SDR n=1 Tax=Sphingopyxis granuli TaxID=267128 RepID=A0AA86L4M8_9SPHN|nr:MULTISPECIES: SDR family NAD(P)-dependent oxidoreductase [Sphingopyxis]AMG76389.1 Short-chain dehydrogenase/reductase SDR [Sphingopyxis granuli]APW73944.1 2,5-dichloro-2,5-cyclohexadiene-1,4-diol dehydrogenase [Sphingopyxis granuli]AVA15274.1 SDR family NAD(P)-dependent oxidoreductase [Sphingopyxis sp. MG]
MRFAGKVAVVTGAASGIGKAAVLKLASEGAHVFAADIDEAGGQALAAASNGRIDFIRCDVTQPADIEALMNAAAAKGGGIDIVFNNAGAGGDRAPIDEIAPEGWDRTMDLLLKSVAMGIRYAAPHMKGRPSTKNGGASIVNTASVAAMGAGYSPTAYAVAKAGVLHLTKVAATDLAQYGIRVNAICPGFINTNIFTESLEVPEASKDAAKAIIADMSAHAQPVARGGQPEDIANAVAYLASEDAGFMTGTHMLVDGGLTIGQRHAWDPNEPGMFDALTAMEEAAKAGAAA